MRAISKRPPPAALVEWRQERIAAHGADGFEFDYDALRRDTRVIQAVEDGLHQEQGRICAYTGRRIHLGQAPHRRAGFHIEHLKPQQHCVNGEDTDYQNLLACWPASNHPGDVEYGAKKKGNWPAPEESAGFVSPLRPDCGQRFLFDNKGGIGPAFTDDLPASQTISRLALDHHELIAFRREAVRGALNPLSRPIRLTDARKLRDCLLRDEQALNQGQDVSLRPYCFVIQQAVEREIRKLAAIKDQTC